MLDLSEPEPEHFTVRRGVSPRQVRAEGAEPPLTVSLSPKGSHLLSVVFVVAQRSSLGLAGCRPALA